MAHNKKRQAPVPPGNQSHSGPAHGQQADTEHGKASQGDGAFSEQDPKRRLGDYATAGEHAFQQPGGKNGANRDRGQGEQNKRD